MSNIITDAELVSKYAQQAMEEPEVVITSRAPSDPEVRLPGGFVSDSGLVTTAEVRELNGADEEAISKAGSRAKALNLLLQRGLVGLGGKEVGKDDLDNLLSGDRDAILIGIRTITFGDELELQGRCFNCNQDQDIVVNLSEDVPVKTLDDQAAREWSVETRMGTAVLTLPVGRVQKRLMDNADKTASEINTLLLAGCLLSLGDKPAIGAPTALSLGMADRTKLVDDILDRNPGPRLGEVKKPCKACGEDMPLPLSLLDLFRL